MLRGWPLERVLFALAGTVTLASAVLVAVVSPWFLLLTAFVGANQWLYVVAGEGVAIVTGTRVELREGTLLLIERGETHEIRNTGSEPLRTLNLYVPPAYTADGDERPAGKP